MAIVFSAKITGQISADDIYSKGNYYTGSHPSSSPPLFSSYSSKLTLRDTPAGGGG